VAIIIQPTCIKPRSNIFDNFQAISYVDCGGLKVSWLNILLLAPKTLKNKHFSPSKYLGYISKWYSYLVWVNRLLRGMMYSDWPLLSIYCEVQLKCTVAQVIETDKNLLIEGAWHPFCSWVSIPRETGWTKQACLISENATLHLSCYL